MKLEKEIGGRKLSIEWGKYAKQASGAVTVQYGETVVLVTVTIGEPPEELINFSPLVVDYRERTYAAGKIPGGFYKREGKPREKEILSSRLIDRSIRPLIPKTFLNEIQIMATVLSADQENDPDICSVIGASTALAISSFPGTTLIGAIRIGKLNNRFIINPTYEEIDVSELDLVIAGTEKNIFMMEGEAKEVSEETITEAIKFAQPYLKEITDLEQDLLEKISISEKLTISSFDLPYELEKEIREFCYEKMKEVLSTLKKKITREKRINEITKKTLEHFKDKITDVEMEMKFNLFLESIEKEIVRKLILEKNYRVDGRNPDEIRTITCAVGVLPRTHGSGIFTRGETQALVTTTLGTTSDKQIMDELECEYKKRFMLHYNFPPFSTGEVRPNRGPGRREIGHGALAEKALKPILPNEDEFPYTIRIVSDILESNGSSSMATVCGGSLSLMDAGVPIKSSVAGISIGYVSNNEKYVLLSDIIGTEDFFGNMDFKVAGTRQGITAIQLDLKTEQMDIEILTNALQKAKEGRFKILDKMEETIKTPRKEISKFAPKIITLNIDPDKIREVIGPGGKTINKIQDQTNSIIEIQNDGKITIIGDTEKSILSAKEMVEYFTADVKVGKIYKGKILRLKDFGAFVEILPGKEGLLHISQIFDRKIESIYEVLKEGDEILVKCIEIDHQGRINLSHKAAIKELKKNNL